MQMRNMINCSRNQKPKDPLEDPNVLTQVEDIGGVPVEVYYPKWHESIDKPLNV